MTKEQFAAALAAQGYDEVLTRELEANFSAAEHTHPFGVRALVLTGDITLTVDGVQSVYRAGDEFEMAPECPHEEAAGPQGVQFLLGRKHVA